MHVIDWSSVFNRLFAFWFCPRNRHSRRQGRSGAAGVSIASGHGLRRLGAFPIGDAEACRTIAGSARARARDRPARGSTGAIAFLVGVGAPGCRRPLVPIGRSGSCSASMRGSRSASRTAIGKGGVWSEQTTPRGNIASSSAFRWQAVFRHEIGFDVRTACAPASMPAQSPAQKPRSINQLTVASAWASAARA